MVSGQYNFENLKHQFCLHFCFSDSDFWFTFCNDPYTKYLILPTAIFSIVFLFPLYIIIFQHIQDKGFRTVLTYGENIVYLNGFIWFYVTFTIDTIRLFSGPLPPSFCWFKKLSQNFAAIGIQFGLLVCILIRVSPILIKVLSKTLLYLDNWMFVTVSVYHCVQISGNLS